jgi:NADPH2:quinone reductase
VRRVICREWGPLDSLEIEELPDPVPGPGEVVVAVEAAGVGFVDSLVVQGRYQYRPPLPFVPGCELAGRVSAVGDGVDSVSLGDRVLATSFAGGFLSHSVLPAGELVPVPASLSMGQAAGLIASYGTMLYTFTRRVPLAAGEWVAVLGGGGGIGLATIGIAKALGARVVACASSPGKLDAATAAGADSTIAYADEGVDVKARIRELTDGGADVLVDPVGGPLSASALRALRFLGRYVVIGFASGTIADIPMNQVLLNNRTIVGIDWGDWAQRRPAENAALLDELFALVRDGRVKPGEPTAYPLEEAGQALADLEARRVTGKAILVP